MCLAGRQVQVSGRIVRVHRDIARYAPLDATFTGSIVVTFQLGSGARVTSLRRADAAFGQLLVRTALGWVNVPPGMSSEQVPSARKQDVYMLRGEGEVGRTLVRRACYTPSSDAASRACLLARPVSECRYVCTCTAHTRSDVAREVVNASEAAVALRALKHASSLTTCRRYLDFLLAIAVFHAVHPPNPVRCRCCKDAEVSS
jgi:hypothetical protein